MKQEKREILITKTPYDKRIAVMEGGELMELVVESQESSRVLGNIYKGIVQKVLPGLQAAFVEIGMDKAGFLHVDDVIDRNFALQAEYGEDDGAEAELIKPTIDQLLVEGQEIMVQVVKEPISTKGARLTTHLTFPGRFLVCMPNTNFVGVSKKERDMSKRREFKRLVQRLKSHDVGYIVRTNGLNETEHEIELQMRALELKWSSTQENFDLCEGPRLIYQESSSTETTLRDYFSDSTDFVYIDDKLEYKAMKDYLQVLSPDKMNKIKLWSNPTSLFEQFKVEEEYEKTLQRKVPLQRGGYLIIEQTEALVSIDVNTGPKVHGRDQGKNILETNIDACHEIAKQMRLRDMGGLILIDFIDMNTDESKDQVVSEFKKCIRKDKSPVSFVPISPFGLLEVTRKRVRENLLTSKSVTCHTCKGKGYVYSLETTMSQMDRWLSRCTKMRGPKKLSLIVGTDMVDLLLESRAHFFKYLEDKHGVVIDMYEDERTGPNDFYFIDESGEDITEKYLFAF
jgi:ribonuclease G